jgi:hypothetical protein
VQCQNLVPFTQFPIDLANNQLPDYSFITPNLCNDAHNCSLSTADNWLKKNIAPLIASATFQQDGLLLVLFDESGSDNTHGGGRVYWTAIGPKVKSGYQSTFSYYQHQSTERLTLEALGLKSFPGAGATAPSMAEFFGSSTSTISVSILPTSVTVASGGTQQFTDTVTGTTKSAVTWSATKGTVSNTGLYTAPTVTSNTTATVKATSVADPTKSATATVTITPPPTTGTKNFSLSATPQSRTVVRGSTTNYTITVAPLNGFTGSVAFAVTGLSGGAKASFSPASVKISGTSSISSTMTVATSSGKTGTFSLTISGSSGSITHSTTASLTTTK